MPDVAKRATTFGMEPANSIIEKFGGAAAVAEIVGRHRTQVTRWTWSKARGGANGRVPQEHVDTLIAAAAKADIALSLTDFFPTTAAVA